MATTQVTTAVIKDGSISTAKIANDAVTLAKMAPAVDGSIISFDASQNPVLVAPGNDGQVLTSAGAGAQPAFETPAAGGAWNILGTADISNDANVTFTGLAAHFNTYAMLGFVISGLQSVNNNVALGILVGAGTTVDTTANYGHHASNAQSSSTNYGAQAGQTEPNWKPNETIGNDTGKGMSGVYYLSQGIDNFATLHGTTVMFNGGDAIHGGHFFACKQEALTLGIIRFSAASGNLSEGRITMYGIAHA